MGRIEGVFGSLAKIATIRMLAEADRELTGREVWQGLRKRHDAPQGLGTVQRALDELVAVGVVERKDVVGSRAKLHRLDREHPFVQRGILPLLEFDQPVGDPVAALRSLLSNATDRLGLLSIAIEPLDDTPGEVVVHFLPRGGTDDQRAMPRLRRMIAFVADSLDRGVRLERHTFQTIRERAERDPTFRDRVIVRGVSLAGSNFATLVDPVSSY